MSLKRCTDAVVSGAGLVVLSPLLAALWVAVRIDSPGPAIFRQTRVGRHGVPFTLLKFRTMRSESGGGLHVTPAGDHRVTRVGGVLRATKLDELPQLVNVLKGDMSLVGPRPEVPRYVDMWTAENRAVILSERPGITDPTSIAFARESVILGSVSDPERYYVDVLLPEKQAMYVEYVRTRSFGGDIRLLGATFTELVGHGKH